MGISIRDAEVTNGAKLVGRDDNSVHGGYMNNGYMEWDNTCILRMEN